MDDLYSGRAELGGEVAAVKVDIRSQEEARQRSLFGVQRILSRIAPHLHHWNRNVFFGVDRLKEDTGWKPEYCFRTAVDQTWDWMRQEGLDQSLEFDFSFEDDLITRFGA
jgi:nucleoside-diphosphate-sugar epimerase